MGNLILLLDSEPSRSCGGWARREPQGGAERADVSDVAVCGGWSRVISEFAADGCRIDFVRERGASELRSLSLRELQVCRLIARGYSSKQISAELGVAAATVRGALDRALKKLELGSSVQLPLLCHAIQGSCRSTRDELRDVMSFFVSADEFSLGSLTTTERELVFELLRAKSNREIASERRVSRRTVANQLSALFRKLGVSSRVEVAVAVLSRGRERSARS